MNVIFGAGGFAREVGWLLHHLETAGKPCYPLDAYVVSDAADNIGGHIHGAKIIGETAFFASFGNKDINAFIAVGSPQLKYKIQEKCSRVLDRVQFPPLIHPSTCLDERTGAVQVGRGTIICAGTILTTDIEIGDFVHLNLGCTVGHDTVIGSYSTLSPGIHVSGRVSIADSCFIGTGAVILENIKIPAETIIGAGATVVRTIDEPGTYLGTPAVRRQRT